MAGKSQVKRPARPNDDTSGGATGRRHLSGEEVNCDDDEEEARTDGHPRPFASSLDGQPKSAICQEERGGRSDTSKASC